jgi:septal ring factor EnvC (AmiA/AmiB activator)
VIVVLPWVVEQRHGEHLVAEEVDLRFLGEQIKRLQGDVRVLKSDMAQVRADSARVESDVASVKADIARVDTKLEVFRESVDDRFDRSEEFTRSNFATVYGRLDTLSGQLSTLSDRADTQFNQLLSEIRSLKRT